MKTWYLILFTLAACSKSVQDKKEDLADQIVNKKYAVTSLTGKHADGTLIPEWYDTIPSWQKDDYFLFKADSTWTGNYNTQKEPGHTEEIFDSGTWTLTNNQYLQLTGTFPMSGGNPAAYWPLKIVAVTDSTLKYESMDPNGGGDMFWGTFTILP